MIMSFKSPVLIMCIVLLLPGCGRSAMDDSWRDNAKTEAGQYRIYSINIYKNTPAWKLANAVRSQNTKKIAEIAKSRPKLLEYHDPIYGQTLLIWAVGMERYGAAEALLKAGANPNATALKIGGRTALHEAARFAYVDQQAKKDPKYVKLLLKYGADPNIGLVGAYKDDNEIGQTPLMDSIACGIEKTKALVEAGANINATTPTGRTAAIDALMLGAPGALDTHILYPHYLIAEKHADVTKPWLPKPLDLPNEQQQRIEPVTLLRRWTPRLDSECYKMKMDIVKEFARQGVDYWKTEIPKDVLENIKERYPDTWQEYIKKY